MRLHFVLPLFALTLLALPDAARAGCWDNCCGNWSEFEAACACQGGHAVPNPPRCEGGGGGGYAAPAPVDPRALQLQRWQLLLQKNIVDAGTYAGLPVDSDAGLAVALTQLYAEFYRDTAVWNAEAADFSARYDLTMAIHKEFYAPRFSRIDASDGLDPEVRAPNQAAKAKLAELQAELARRRALRERFVNGEQALGRSERMRNEFAIASRRRLDYFFGGFTKDEVEHTTGALSPTPPMATCCEDPAFPLPLDWAAAPSAPLGPQMAANNAAAAVEAARNATAPTLTGDTETRLQAAEQQAVKAEAAHKSFEEWRKYNNVVEQSAVSDARTWASTVADNVAVLKETYGLTHKDIPALEIEVQHAKDVLNGNAWEFYTNGAAAAAWSFFSEHVVVPEIKRIALEMHSTENYALTDAEIESAWHQDTHGLFGAYDVYQKGKDAAALIEQAKNLEGTAEASALAVADVMGRADIGNYKEVGDKLFGNLDSAARDEVREALGQVDLPSPVKKFWEGYFTGVKPTFD